MTAPGRFYVECPNCARESGSYSPAMVRGGRHCSCGMVFAIDVDSQQAGRIITEPE